MKKITVFGLMASTTLTMANLVAIIPQNTISYEIGNGSGGGSTPTPPTPPPSSTITCASGDGVTRTDLINLIDAGADVTSVCTSNITDFSRLFYKYRDSDSSKQAIRESFNQDISKWDVSNGVDFSLMFRESASFNQDIGTWDLSKGENLTEMFYQATSFDQNIGVWNLSSAKEIHKMFYGATSFNNNGVDNMRNLITSNITEIRGIFQSASSFNQDISGWNVSNVVEFLDVFQGATSFNNGGSADLKNWDVSSGQYFTGMFLDATSFDQDLGDWNMSNSLGLLSMFNGATSFSNGGSNSIKDWDVSNAVDFRGMFMNASSFNVDIHLWDVNSVYSGRGANFKKNSGLDPRHSPCLLGGTDAYLSCGLDTDGDGVFDYLEIQNGSDPLDPLDK